MAVVLCTRFLGKAAGAVGLTDIDLAHGSCLRGDELGSLRLADTSKEGLELVSAQRQVVERGVDEESETSPAMSPLPLQGPSGC